MGPPRKQPPNSRSSMGSGWAFVRNHYEKAGQPIAESRAETALDRDHAMMANEAAGVCAEQALS